MKRIPVIVLGAGGVGGALLRQIVDGRSRVASRIQCSFDVVAVADSQGFLWQPNGLDNDHLLELVKAKNRGYPLHSLTDGINGAILEKPLALDILERAAKGGLAPGILVDVTAAQGMEEVIDRALALNFRVVMANKKALAGPWQTAQVYYNHPWIRHESTVGGGQPVIATLRYLLDVNDPIIQIQGQLSGTLGFICSRLDQGIPFSQAIAQAKANGFTEPDPREDLSGLDVMRKVLILGRMAGWSLEEASISVESLYPAEMASLVVDEFMTAAARLDEEMQRRVDSAAAEGYVLRYVAQVEEGAGTVGLQVLPAASPLANLKYISFRTVRYDDEPLLIGGKGAGVEMTAAGVLGDMIALAREVIV